MCSRSGQVSQEGLLDVFKERSRQTSPSLTLIVRGLLAAASSRPVRLPALTKNYPRVNKESPPPFAQEARSHWKGEPLIFLVLTHKNFNVSGKRGAPRPGNLAAAF